MPKQLRRVWVIIPALLIILSVVFAANKAGAAINTGNMSGYAGSSTGNSSAVVGSPMVSHSIKNDVSPPLREIAAKLPKSTAKGEIGDEVELPPWDARPLVKDLVLQRDFGDHPFAMPTPIANFEGVNNIDGVYPPDTTGDVGPNDFVQWVNLHYQIYSKTGTPRLPNPLPGNAFWSGFGGVCQTTNNGDPLVLYDSMADRWVVSQFAFTSTSTPPYHQCVAVSTTSDPTGTYNRYDFVVSNSDFNDYGKMGVWPDAYYQSYVRFSGGSSYVGQQAVAFDRTAMLAGNPSTMVSFNIGTVVRTLLPADLDGLTLPPAGAPNVFSGIDSSSAQLDLWKFHVDFGTPANSTFTGPTAVPVAAFNRLCTGTRSCIPQPGTTVKIDGIGDRLMYRGAYRNFGDHEALVLNHTVDAGSGKAGVRWYEVRSPANSPSLFQQGTYSPDAINRWMGSAAMDHMGNLAVGYSVSDGTSVFPGIRYAGRLAGDTPGQLDQGEATLINGSGSQTGTAFRWGDYSMMTIDPTDDCTFWYTTEYYQTTSAVGWQTRVGSFKFPNCSIGTPTPTVTGTPPTNTPTRTRTSTSTPTNTPCSVTSFTSTDVPKTICDLCTVTSTLTMPGGTGNIGSLDLTGLDVTHTYLGDLIVTLISPVGTQQVLIYRVCTSSHNFSNITLSDGAAEAIGLTCPPTSGQSYQPSNPLSAFAGQNPAGTWSLVVSDNAGVDVGTLNAWGLRININTGCGTPTNTPTITRTRTITNTPTVTRTNTSTNTPTKTNTPTFTNTPTNTYTPTPYPGDAFSSIYPGVPITVNVNTQFSLDLLVNSGSYLMTGQTSYLTFTNSILKNVIASQTGCVQSGTVTGDYTNFVTDLQNEVCNGPAGCTFPGSGYTDPGSIAYGSAVAFSNPGISGEFHTAQLAFCATAAGDATLHWQFSPPDPANRSSEIRDQSNNLWSNPTLYTDYQVHVIPYSGIVGHVTWQGRPTQPSVSQQMPISLTLRPTGGGPATEFGGMWTGSDGTFAVPTTSLALGTYTWRAKGPAYLAVTGTLTLTGAPTVNVEMGTQPAGDIDNDNTVGLNDFTLLKSTFGKLQWQAGYNPHADYDGNGNIGLGDFTILKANFGRLGAGAIRPSP